jgi:glutamate N-acetyltransferase / amino-acid N-acetyltransferase
MNPLAAPLNSTLLPKGFAFSAVAAGVKASGRLDLALIEASRGTTAAAVFTKNRVVAAPLLVDRASLAASRGRVRAVVVNSGNANCATGPAGLRACRQICGETARLLGVNPEEVFPSSTGIIGVPLPAEKIVSKLPQLIAAQQASEQGLNNFVQAIMTTDLRPKVASAEFRSGNNLARLTGVAKGSGMIHPQLATMLVYLCTDAKAGTGELRPLLRQTCDQTFNCILVDGDTSTNDTVLLLASGQSTVSLHQSGVRKQFAAALLQVCQSLAEQIVADGEGVQHVIRLFVEQASSRREALQVAKAIARSPLVKTAWAGADPNWGRILAAVGSCGVPILPDQLEIAIGKQLVFRGGQAHPFDQAGAHQDMAQPSCDIRVKLRRGRSGVRLLTTDLTAEYIRINADYST